MEIAHHIYHHCTGYRCGWNRCYKTRSNIVELHLHLETDHDIYTDLTLPTKVQFCFECTLWIISEPKWALHAGHHTKKPAILCGPVFVQGMLASPGRCPYCIPSGIYTQYETPVYFLQHVERHLVAAERECQPLVCPHPACGGQQYSREGIRDHLEDVQNIQVSCATSVHAWPASPVKSANIALLRITRVTQGINNDDGYDTYDDQEPSTTMTLTAREMGISGFKSHLRGTRRTRPALFRCSSPGLQHLKPSCAESRTATVTCSKAALDPELPEDLQFDWDGTLVTKKQPKAPARCLLDTGATSKFVSVDYVKKQRL